MLLQTYAIPLTYPCLTKLGRKLDDIIDILHKTLGKPDRRPRTYRQIVRKDYLSIVCNKKPGKKAKEVYNTGPKISKKAMQRIFTAGYTTKESEARGYGLYLVKKLVDRYGGKISVMSGERTTFIVHLPDKKERKRC